MFFPPTKLSIAISAKTLKTRKSQYFLTKTFQFSNLCVRSKYFFYLEFNALTVYDEILPDV